MAWYWWLGIAIGVVSLLAFLGVLAVGFIEAAIDDATRTIYLL